MATAYINLYVSGFYHRMGKPNQYNAHPGDMYPTREAAEADVGPRDLYLGTVPVTLPDDLHARLGAPNKPDSVPMPLGQSKVIYQTMGASSCSPPMFDQLLHYLVNGFDLTEYASLVLRLGVGVPFFISGMNKLFCPICHGWLVSNLKRSGIPSCGGFTVWWLAFWEAFAGLMLALGILTAFHAGVLLIVCIVAFIVSWRRKLEAKKPAHFWDACTEIGFMFDVLLIWMLVAIIGVGPGPFSIDALIGWVK